MDDFDYFPMNVETREYDDGVDDPEYIVTGCNDDWYDDQFELGEQDMDFLIRAQRYTEARGDDNFFCHYYTMYREYFSVNESVRKTIEWLYDDRVADLLEFQ